VRGGKRKGERKGVGENRVRAVDAGEGKGRNREEVKV